MELSLDGGVVEIVGALDFDRTETGIAPRRLPAWNLPAVWHPTRALTIGFPMLVVLGYGLNDTGVLVIALMGTIGLAVAVSVANHRGVENELTVPDYRAFSTDRIRGGLRHAVRERSHRP